MFTALSVFPWIIFCSCYPVLIATLWQSSADFLTLCTIIALVINRASLFSFKPRYGLVGVYERKPKWRHFANTKYPRSKCSLWCSLHNIHLYNCLSTLCGVFQLMKTFPIEITTNFPTILTIVIALKFTFSKIRCFSLTIFQLALWPAKIVEY